MKTGSLALAFSLFLAGCGSTIPTFVAPVPKSPPRDYIAEMKAYARVHHLAYWIFCLDWSDNPDAQFQAMLCNTEDGTCRGTYIEDGVREWMAASGPTQQEAAKRLMQAVAERGMYRADHKPQDRTRRQCPLEIKGSAE